MTDQEEFEIYLETIALSNDKDPSTGLYLDPEVRTLWIQFQQGE